MLELTKYSVRPEKKVRNYINSPETEIRDKISDLIKREFKVVCGLTRHLSVEQMWFMYNKAIKWDKNSEALFWKLLKESKVKLHGVQEINSN